MTSRSPNLALVRQTAAIAMQTICYHSTNDHVCAYGAMQTWTVYYRISVSLLFSACLPPTTYDEHEIVVENLNDTLVEDTNFAYT